MSARADALGAHEMVSSGGAYGGSVERIEVPGGWLYLWSAPAFQNEPGGVAMVFVPTPVAGVGACPHAEGKTQAECEHCKSWLASCIKKGG